MRKAARIRATAVVLGAAAAWLVSLQTESHDTESREPVYAKPSDIESRIFELIAERLSSVVSINSVSCGPTKCEVAFVGTDPNPRSLGEPAKFSTVLYRRDRQDFRILNEAERIARETNLGPLARECGL